MKILFLSQGSKIEDQPGYELALSRAESFGRKIDYINIPICGYAHEHGWEQTWDYIERVNCEVEPDMVFFQFFHNLRIKGVERCLRNLKSANNHPLIMGSAGDLFQNSYWKIFVRKFPPCFLSLGKYADAVFVSSMGNAARYLEEHGCKNIIFLPHAFSAAHFELGSSMRDANKIKFDVVSLMSLKLSLRILPRFRVWLGGFIFAVDRFLTARLLSQYYNLRFGLFGRGWRFIKNEGPATFRDQCKVFEAGRVAIDGDPPYFEEYYASDRPFFIAGSGTPLVQFYTPRFEKIFRPEENVYFVRDRRELLKVCDRVLSLDSDTLLKRREATINLVRERHMVEHRIDTIISTVEAIRLYRKGEMSLDVALRHLRLWHFLPEVDLEDERKYAIVNWRG